MEHICLTHGLASSRLEKLSGRLHYAESQGELNTLLEGKSETSVTVWVSAAQDSLATVAADLRAKNYRFVVLYNKPDVNEMFTVLNLGAKAYASVAASSSVLERITRVIHQGGLWVPEQFLANLTGLLHRNSAPTASEPESFAILSKRERQVCDKVLAGQTNQQIADSLFVSERTVKAHLTSSFQKLGVKDRLQLVLKVQRELSSSVE